MTIKLCLLKSGEDIIADVSEMNVGKEEERNVVGYFLDRFIYINKDFFCCIRKVCKFSCIGH